MMATRLAPRRAAALLGAVALLALPATRPANPTPLSRAAQQPHASVNGAILVLDQRGSTSSMVQITPRHDEILAVEGGRVTRVLARGLTTYSCCVGLAPSPRGRYVAFTQTDAYLPKRIVDTKGLWLTTSDGQRTTRLFPAPAPANPGEPFDIAAVAWSPDRYTLAYAVDLFTDTNVAPSLLQGSGLWLAPYDKPNQRRLVFPFAPGGAYAPILTTACGRGFSNPAFYPVSWAPDGRTVAASLTCIVPTPSSIRGVQAVLAIDTRTGRARVLVENGRDAAFAPGAPALAYVTGDEGGKAPSTLWVADAQGQHARKLVTVQGQLISPAWSPDGRAIAYVVGSPYPGQGTTAIRTVDVATGQIQTVLTANQPGQPLLPTGGHFTRLAWMHSRV